MIGAGLKKLAKEYGMTVSGGVAYGAMGNYAATLNEGSGYKEIYFATSFSDLAKRTLLMDLLNQDNTSKTYRLRGVNSNDTGIRIVFGDTIGTMKRIRNFLAWFLPLLEEHGASTIDICLECGCKITEPCWIQVNGICFPVHGSCAQKNEREIEAENTQRLEEDTGSYGMGALGAFIGALLGALVWALVLLAGYVASIVGLLIGWLADKGYDLLKGKQGKAKVVILILAVIFGVVAGTFGADVITLAGMIRSGELPGIAMGDIPVLLVFMLSTEPEYLSATISNIGMGLLFAALGVFYMLKQTARDVSGTKFRYMK